MPQGTELRPLVQATHYPDEAVPGLDVSPRFLRHRLVVPIGEEEGRLVLAMADTRDDETARAIEIACARPVARRMGLPSEIEAAIDRLYGAGKSRLAQIVDAHGVGEPAGAAAAAGEDVEQLRDLAGEAPAVRLVAHVIERALACGASDIHIEPFATRLQVRYRIDGVLQAVEAPPVQLAPAIVSRIKIMAKLDIAERRLPQDGRISLRLAGAEHDVDARVSTVPTLHGESVVLRLLRREAVALELSTLGFAPAALEAFARALDQPHGLILVTGPTGSGKTTTLYTALARLNTQARKVVTVEDPVEYQLEGVNQIQVKPAIQLGFASALRSIVRQDPDVIMVGEMRDAETARICVQSALTGHLVLSTLHTNDAPGSVTRLLDMGVEDYLVTSTVNAVVAQRLVRVLCGRCRTPWQPSQEEWRSAGLARLAGPVSMPLYRAAGCEHCAGTGYRGRTAVLELMPMSERLRRLVLSHAETSALRAAARDEGMRTMYEHGLEKALAGTTSLEEVLRVATQA